MSGEGFIGSLEGIKWVQTVEAVHAVRLGGEVRVPVVDMVLHEGVFETADDGVQGFLWSAIEKGFVGGEEFFAASRGEPDGLAFFGRFKIGWGDLFAIDQLEHEAVDEKGAKRFHKPYLFI